MTSAQSVDAAAIRATLGAVLREHREGAGRTLTHLAGEAGCSPAYLSEVERGLKDVSTELLVALTYALRVPVAAVYADVGARLGAPADDGARDWRADPRGHLRVLSAALDTDTLRTVAQFGAFLAAGGEGARRPIGFRPSRRSDT